MILDDFLPSVTDQARRARLWDIFNHARQQAGRFMPPGEAIRIDHVAAGQANSWRDGTLTLRWPAEGGTLLHGLFRRPFQRSRFNDGTADGKWCGAFCDAFRYFMQRQLGLADEWLALVERLCGRPAPPYGSPTVAGFCYPASLLIVRAGRDYDLFQDVWFDLQEQRMQANQPLLDWKFGYVPPILPTAWP